MYYSLFILYQINEMHQLSQSCEGKGLNQTVVFLLKCHSADGALMLPSAVWNDLSLVRPG